MNTESTYPIDLITSYFAGEASGDDLTFIAEWLKADPKHREFFESYRKTWTNLEESRIGSQVDLDLEWNELKLKLDFSSSSKLQPILSETNSFNRFFSSRAFRIAAIIILLLVPATFIYFYLAQPNTRQLSAQTSMFEGQLPDGTSVTLNTGSSIEYPSHFKTHERDVKLTGEAYFEVTHDKTSPFIISAGDVRIKVLGTSFYVNTNALNGGMQVVLTSGQVEVYYKDNLSEKVILAPGEKADISVDQHDIVLTTNDDPNYLSWKTRKLIFTNDPLDKVVNILGKIYHTNIRIENPVLRQCVLTATFDNQSLESVLKVVSATLNVKITQNGTLTVISGNGCK
jgi:transmembrane sensor